MQSLFKLTENLETQSGLFKPKKKGPAVFLLIAFKNSNIFVHDLTYFLEKTSNMTVQILQCLNKNERTNITKQSYKYREETSGCLRRGGAGGGKKLVRKVKR